MASTLEKDEGQIARVFAQRETLRFIDPPMFRLDLVQESFGLLDANAAGECLHRSGVMDGREL